MEEPPEPEQRYRVLEKLLSQSNHLHRYRVQDQFGASEVELRVSRGQLDDGGLGALFGVERDELSRLDHPGFLPVLDRGTLQGRAFYTVPWRNDPFLVQLGTDATVSLSQRVALVTRLASALQAAHRVGIVVGMIHLPMLAVDGGETRPYFLHHRALPDSWGPAITDRLPEDCLPSVEATRRSNLFHWGRAAYWLLSRGTFPFPADAGREKRKPTRMLSEEIPTALAEVVDACLDWHPEGRPEDAIELMKAVEDAGVHTRIQVVPDVGSSGGIRLTESLDLTAEQLAAGVPGLDPELARQIGKRRRQRQEERAAKPEGSSGRKAAMAGSLVAVGLLVGVLLPLGPSPASPVAPRQPSPPSPVASRAPRPKPPPPVARDIDPAVLAKDLSVRSLLRGEGFTPPEKFRSRWENLVRLSVKGRLPPDMNDRERIDGLGALFLTEPEAACRELDAYRRSLGRYLETPKVAVASGSTGTSGTPAPPGS